MKAMRSRIRVFLSMICEYEQVISFSASFATLYKLIGESADRNVTIFVRTNYNSLKKAWQSWQKFGERTRFGDCKALIVICLRTFLICRRWCGAKLRNKYSSGLNDIRSDANVPIYRRSISSGDSPVMSAMS